MSSYLRQGAYTFLCVVNLLIIFQGIKVAPNWRHKPKKVSVLPSVEEVNSRHEQIDSNDSSNDYDYPDLSKMEFSISSPTYAMTQRPVGLVTPKVKHVPDEDKSDNLEDYTVDKLCATLYLCGLISMVDICKNEKVDGQLLCTLTDEDLIKPPFNLGNLQILKLRHIRMETQNNLK